MTSRLAVTGVIGELLKGVLGDLRALDFVGPDRGPGISPGPFVGQALFTSMRWRCACSALGMRTVSTPSLSLASIFLGSTWLGRVTR